MSHKNMDVLFQYNELDPITGDVKKTTRPIIVQAVVGRPYTYEGETAQGRPVLVRIPEEAIAFACPIHQ